MYLLWRIRSTRFEQQNTAQLNTPHSYYNCGLYYARCAILSLFSLLSLYSSFLSSLFPALSPAPSLSLSVIVSSVSGTKQKATENTDGINARKCGESDLLSSSNS